MHLLAWFLSGFALVAWLSMGGAMLAVARHCGLIDRVPPEQVPTLPRLSIVVPARNEAGTVEPAMLSVLALDYPDIEVIAVDDRSEDATGAILDRLAASNSRLRVVHLHDLPGGWLGKCNALQVGGGQASGEWILFTDADVVFAPDALLHTMRYVQARRLDHLSLFPQLILDRPSEASFVGFFSVMFCWHYRPWEAADPKRGGYAGMGAFNLVRTEAYRRAGSHTSLRMAIVDDVELGHHLKLSGARSECRSSGHLVRVRWLPGLLGAMRGLTKNMFAGMGFRPLSVVVLSAALVLSTAWPVAGAFVGPIGSRLVCAAALGMMMLTSRSVIFGRCRSPLVGLGYPFVSLLFAYTMWRSMLATYRNGGVVWRGTLYPLAELRDRMHGGR